ncbi:hypothetical protein DFQ27_004619 [Actinomortierella ambigua]|uniref:SGNH hydrolase-type esterase domain-containing protein n=1 Tax=Actinomortierella ambigua TaxID=1343610 RepID=A0A9P6U486_9FUNG|nr:hypothetical protein DFQ27_004619 [Actinomortierella ambigua]
MEAIAEIGRQMKTFFVVLAFYVKLGFLHLARWYEPKLRKNGKYNHTIVVLGDDHAMGLGDYTSLVTGSGLTSKVAKEIAKERSIRQSWQVFNRGEYHTSSEDWLLAADSKRLEKPSLLARTLDDPKMTKADIVIILLGSYDVQQRGPNSITPEDTVRNLELICQAIQRHSNGKKSIYLSTIPTAGDQYFLSDAQQEENKQRNRLIEKYAANNEDGVFLGVQVDHYENFEFRRKNLYWKDGRHFSDIGYTKLAKDYFPLIKSDMIKREFSLYRRDLGL